MKIRLSKEAILDGLQKVQSIVGARTTLPILSNALFKAEDKRVWLTTTDLEVSVRTGVEAEVLKAGASTLPARRVFGIFRELPGPEVEIEVDEKNVAVVKSGSSVFKVVGISEDDFPPLPRFEAARSYTLEQGAFRDMIQKTVYASSTDETRYVLNGILLSFQGEKLMVVATDGRRLALVEREVEFPKEAQCEMILPAKTAHELVRTLADDGQLTIRAAEKQVAFEFNEMLVVSKLIEGTYPNFRQVIPAQCEERVTIEREALLMAVRRVSLMTSEQSNSVRLSFGKNRLEVVVVTPDVGEARETLPIKYAGKEINVAFNPAYVMDPLKSLECDEIALELTDDLSPGVLKADIPFLYVLMPMRLT